jgi:hypothetical protein
LKKKNITVRGAGGGSIYLEKPEEDHRLVQDLLHLDVTQSLHSLLQLVV